MLIEFRENAMPGGIPALRWQQALNNIPNNIQIATHLSAIQPQENI